MFRFTQTIIRELQPVLNQNYNSGSSTHVVISVISVMAAHLYHVYRNQKCNFG